jgi:hypothetical protein
MTDDHEAIRSDPLVDRPTEPMVKATSILRYFILMSVLFSANHGCVVACLSLATARLGSLGAYQSGLLYVNGYVSGVAVRKRRL